jgi:hypothetical protein
MTAAGRAERASTFNVRSFGATGDGKTLDTAAINRAIDARTHRVVAVNNTANEDGERCTLNNPCEVDRDGRITVRYGGHYGQQTYRLARCLGAGNDVVLGGKCTLPRP